MHPLERNAVRGLALDHHAESLRAGREARQVGALRVPGHKVNGAIRRNAALTSDACTSVTRPLTAILTTFSTPADGTDVKAVLPAGANWISEIASALRACTITPATPLPATRIVQIPGSGRAVITMRSGAEVGEIGHSFAPPASGTPDGRATSAV